MSNGEDPATKEVRTTVTDTMAAADKTLPTYAAAINSPNTDALPSYDQVFQQLRKAKENSKSPVDYTVKALGIICGSLIVTILFAISAAIPIAMLVIGSIYKDQCPINRQIPIWLIVGGVVGLLSAVLRSISNCHNMFTKRRLDQEPEQNISNKSALLSILELFLFIWLIIGSVWVYSAKYSVTSDSTDYDNYCHPTCYYFAFWVITVSYIVMATMCCCLCCIVMCVGFGLSLSSLSKDVNNQSQIP